MSDRINRLKATNAAKIDIMDNATASFMKSLDKALGRLNAKVAVWTKELDGDVRVFSNQRNLSRAVNSAAQIEEMLLESGYRNATGALAKSYDNIAEMSMRGFRYAGTGDSFSNTDARAITAIRDLDMKRWQARGDDLALDIQEKIIDSVVSGASFRDMSDSIESVLVGNATKDAPFRNQAETIANTTLQGFDRTLSLRQADKAGIDTFVYLGPDDGITRPFCQAVLDGDASSKFSIPAADENGLYTLDQIEGMDNGQGLPVAQYGGGWNCRHSWNAITAEVAQEALTA